MAASLRTHYDTLGVGRRASPEQVRSAYRRRAQSCHPDKLPAGTRDQAQAAMVEINQAYAVLSDGPGRAAYDRWIEAHEALLAAQRAVLKANEAGAQMAWPWVLLSATIAFSMVTLGTVAYKEVVPSVVTPPRTTESGRPATATDTAAPQGAVPAAASSSPAARSEAPVVVR